MANPFDKFLTYEDREHIQIVNFCRDRLHENVVWLHVPNEGKKSAFERYKHCLMGSLTGAPDFIFLYPKYSELRKDEIGTEYRDLIYIGLAIELKAPEHKRIVMKGKNAGKVVKAKGTVSDKQKEVIDKLLKLQYRAVVAWGAEDAINIIKDYFTLKKHDILGLNR
jgi:hypothetical protein